MMQNKKAQGSLEYLLLIGGAVLVAVIVITLILGIGQSGNQQTSNSAVAAFCKQKGQQARLAGISGNCASPTPAGSPPIQVTISGTTYTCQGTIPDCGYTGGGAPAPPTCGDGICNGTETQATCPADCGAPQPTASCSFSSATSPITISGGSATSTLTITHQNFSPNPNPPTINCGTTPATTATSVSCNATTCMGTCTYTAAGTYTATLPPFTNGTQNATCSPNIRTITVNPDPLTVGLVAYWPFNGTANDASGNGHTGTLVGSPTFPNDPQRGQVLSLNGTQYISVPDSPDLDFGTSDFTITMWVKTSILQQSTIAKAYHNSSPGYGLYRGTFYLTSADGSVAPATPDFLRVASPGPDDGNPADVEAWRNGVWHNIAITITRSPAPWGYFYVDGTERVAWRDVNATKATNISNAWPLLIGAGYVLSPPPTVSTLYRYNGLMDNIRIYSRALSVAEIRQVCAQEKHASFATPDCA